LNNRHPWVFQPAGVHFSTFLAARLQLLLNGAEDKYELENACLPLFSLAHWPSDEQIAYSASQTDTERNQIVLRRMDSWAMEIEVRQSIES
jgi:hypothetical protein